MAQKNTTKELGGTKPKGTFVENLAVLPETIVRVPFYPPHNHNRMMGERK